ncbi:MAG: type pilus assembly protein PilM [Cyanobacteriota bacterium]|jgi:type IV pilus assembly protein PilM|uniref:type IV pilus assembly protein PilM n=1 Tax=Cylindrospermopsis raciborskii TaxID=77022 RepID=UPI001A1F7C10|nr:type IV pilus assembly protein PilM [Cylindrospermopsis raciborskii]MBG0742505.1 type IV pilus assembly protein PilM [Cylindrospermopsis raciborskii KL1]
MVKNLGFSDLFSYWGNFLGKSTRGVGVELTGDRINIAQLHRVRQGLRIESLSTFPVPEGIMVNGEICDCPRMGEIISQAIVESKIKTTQIRTCIPEKHAIVRIIPAPLELEGQELYDSFINQEAGLYLPYPREEADIDCQKLGYFIDQDGIEKAQVLLVATRREITDSYIHTFALAGLKIEVLEIKSFAIIRTIQKQLLILKPEEAVVLVNIEFDHTEVTVIINGVPQFSRTIAIGIFQLENAISTPISREISLPVREMMLMTIPYRAEPELDMLEKLGAEIGRTIDFCINQIESMEVSQIFLSGAGGGMKQLDEFLNDRLGFTTSRINPCQDLLLDRDKFPLSQDPSLAVVLGLGMRQI